MENPGMRQERMDKIVNIYSKGKSFVGRLD